MKGFALYIVFALSIIAIAFSMTPQNIPSIPANEFVVGKVYSENNCQTHKVQYLGNPTINYYTNNSKNEIIARNVWDLQVFNSKIYIGAGDYGTNMGDVPLFYYDCNNKQFVKETTLPEEHISNFKIWDNQLVIPGIDAAIYQTHDWANWYINQNEIWTKYSNLPESAHCFDIIQYEGAIFAGLGGKEYQIARSTDGGKTFKFVPIYSFGNQTNPIRIYNFFVLNDQLYAFNGIGTIPKTYVYNKNKNIFENCSTPHIFYGFCLNESSNNNGGFPFARALEFNDYSIFINNTLVYMNSYENYEKLTLDDNTKILDALSHNDTLYILSGKELENSEWQISIYSTSDFENWTEVLYFTAPTCARSFELIDNSFFFGLGSNYDEANIHNGEILQYEH